MPKTEGLLRIPSPFPKVSGANDVVLADYWLISHHNPEHGRRSRAADARSAEFGKYGATTPNDLGRNLVNY